MTWLLPTTLALALAGPADRAALECSSSGPLNSGALDVSSVRCEGRDGFFVPSLRYRELRESDLATSSLEAENALLAAQVGELKGAVTTLTRTASVVELEVQTMRRIADAHLAARLVAEEQAEKAAERSWYEHPGLWVAVGVAGTVLVVWAVVSMVPDRVLAAL